MGYKRLAWQNDGYDLESKLVFDASLCRVVSVKPKQSWDDLPPIVQNFFRRVLSIPGDSSAQDLVFHPKVRSIVLNQNGSFCVKKGATWRRFSARQVVTGFPQTGFLWDAEMPFISERYPGSIHVRDAWVSGEPKLQASLAGIFTVAYEPSVPDHREPLLIGEMMRWLAEAFLVPTSLLPEAGLVEWKAFKDDVIKVSISMIDPYQQIPMISKHPLEIELNVTFQNEDTVITEAMRPKAVSTGFVTSPWIGVLSNFVSVDDNDSMMPNIKVPAHMKAGWKQENGDISYYFEGIKS